MARGINKVILIGNLGRDPETRYTQSGSPVANFSVATSEGWRDRQTNEMQERTEWHNVVCFARLAEIAGEYLRKGRQVYVEGRLQTRKWQTQDGQDRWSTEIVAREMQMLGGRNQGGFPDSPGEPAPARNWGGESPRRREKAPEPAEDFDDDIPF